MLHCPVVAVRDGNVVVSAKFLEEVEQYAATWPGTVRLIAYEDPNWSTSFGVVTRAVDSLPFELVVRSHDDLDEQIFDGNVVAVLSGIGHRYNHLATLGRARGIPVVYVSEWSRNTQQVITALEAPNALVKARRLFWLWGQQRGIRKCVRAAAALQCNGTPTFDEYARLNDARLLYFDNRITHDLLIDQAALERRLSALAPAHAPLKLIFTGRLTVTKGVLDLVLVARALRERGTPFHLSIVGDGDLVAVVRSEIGRHGLQEVVDVLSPMTFRTELIPFVRTADLFVCPHPQGDPSCTYVETLACGVPIAGYANEALQGIARHSGAAWEVPIGDHLALATEVARLADHRDEIASASRKARHFASEHTFERTYGRRVDQLRQLAGI